MTTVYTYDISLEKEIPFSINEILELKKGNIYLENDKILDIFHQQGNILNGDLVYNNVDITKKGRELFKIPDKYNDHILKVKITF